MLGRCCFTFGTSHANDIKLRGIMSLPSRQTIRLSYGASAQCQGTFLIALGESDSIQFRFSIADLHAARFNAPLFSDALSVAKEGSTPYSNHRKRQVNDANKLEPHHRSGCEQLNHTTGSINAPLMDVQQPQRAMARVKIWLSCLIYGAMLLFMAYFVCTLCLRAFRLVLALLRWLVSMIGTRSAPPTITTTTFATPTNPGTWNACIPELVTCVLPPTPLPAELFL
ncbi:hypothetical protein P154DRAFT_622218 [Amniculicola lignicola CBS 123094]|uniref:Uncharacterized protein n=1 Tax=Amniculicola lignicola CBS 123094 TaxID=1392246 RepID=A0A6A5W9N5_9PLEO|nr:hypothetical protein P154DRAFT_622218 [Amniculicola lignicola CBS 123094]